MTRINVLSGLYILVIFLLFLYSYTQVDLSLTLSKVSIFQTVEKSFQYVGYFQRPLATNIYIGLLLLLFIFYGIFLRLSWKNVFNRKQLWILILCTTILLTFSYNAFSYDLFNYIFDAKIITHYHQNPYQHMALDYSGDPMLSFMHWVERKYPYGPVWLLATVPLSFLGFQYFLLTFFLFKIFTALCFLICVYYVEKILKEKNKSEVFFGLTLFALNPLVLIEGLVSAHNEIPMIALSLLAFFFLVNKKYIWAIILLLLSIGIKFSTVFLFPVFIYVFISGNKKINWSRVFISAVLLTIPMVMLLSYRTNFQPWYVLIVLPFAALAGKNFFIVIPVFIFSLFSLLEYIPFLYTGNWNPPIPGILNGITGSGIVFAFLVTIFWSKRHVLLQLRK